MLELSSLDLEEIALALQDQTGWEHCWLIDPQSGQVGFWTEDGGIDGRTPVDLEELDLIPIEPMSSWVWYRDMGDFAEGISVQRAGRSLARAIEGKGAFRRFTDRLQNTNEALAGILRPGNAGSNLTWLTFLDHRRCRGAHLGLYRSGGQNLRTNWRSTTGLRSTPDHQTRNTRQDHQPPGRRLY